MPTSTHKKARKTKSKFVLAYYAKLFGWSYPTVQRARARGWNLDDYPSLLQLAAHSKGPRLSLTKLQKLVGEGLPPRPIEKRPTDYDDHYESACFSLQPAFARLWAATDKALRQFKYDQTSSSRSLWNKFRDALTQLMKEVPVTDEALRGILEITDLDKTVQKTLTWVHVLMGSLKRHTLARPYFTKHVATLAPLLDAEIAKGVERLSLDLPIRHGPLPKNNPIKDLLALATEERATYADFNAATTVHEQLARQSIYLNILKKLSALARETPKGMKDLCRNAGDIEKQWMRGFTEFVTHLRSMPQRLGTAVCFTDDPVGAAEAFKDEVELLFDRYQKGEEPPPWGFKPPTNYEPYESPPPYTGPSDGRDPRWNRYHDLYDKFVAQNGGDTAFTKSQLKQLKALKRE